MSDYMAKVAWKCEDQEKFAANEYSRGHKWEFDGGITLTASSSPGIVPLPFSLEQAVDPEEALVASVASCHMLFFLNFLARDGYCLTSYEDNAIGHMGLIDDGRIAFKRVVLHPKITFVGAVPSEEELKCLHEESHRSCFIANSVNFPVVVDKTIVEATVVEMAAGEAVE